MNLFIFAESIVLVHNSHRVTNVVDQRWCENIQARNSMVKDHYACIAMLSRFHVETCLLILVLWRGKVFAKRSIDLIDRHADSHRPDAVEPRHPTGALGVWYLRPLCASGNAEKDVAAQGAAQQPVGASTTLSSLFGRRIESVTFLQRYLL